MPNSPYPGIRPFQEGESHLYFGRDEELGAIVEKLDVELYPKLDKKFLAIFRNVRLRQVFSGTYRLLRTLEGRYFTRDALEDCTFPPR